MSRLVEDVLDAWRHAERVLDELPPVDPDHETVRLAIDRLREVYRELTMLKGVSRESLDSSTGTVERAHALLRRVEGRLDRRSDVAARDGAALDLDGGAAG